jgi:LacI family transcriptional regulator
MVLNRNIQKPLQEQMADLLEAGIKSGEFAPDEKLPSLRALAKEYQVSHETINSAMGLLKSRRLVKIVPNRGVYVASGLNGNNRETGFVGLIIDLGKQRPKSSVVAPLYGDFLALISEELNRYGYHLTGNYICIEEEKDKQILANLIENKIDGMIMVNLFYPRLHDFVRDNFYPVVSLLPAEPFDEFDQVNIDIYRTYYKTTAKLLERGVKSVRMLNGPNPHYNFDEMARGVADACRNGGIDSPAAEDFILISPGWDHDDAEVRIEEWLDEGAKADLLIGANDNLALGALNAFQNRGVKIPGDVQVLGGRNTPLCSMVRPQLASVDWHYRELVRITVERLVKRIEGNDSAPMNLQIGGSLVERGSLRKER